MVDEPQQDEVEIPAHPAEPAIASPEDEIAQLTDKWKRAVAEFENYKKRREGETKEVVEYAKQMTVLKLMPTLQNLEQVLVYAPSDEKYKDWLAGLKATILQLEKTMEELGVVKIKTVGEQFDPSRHEAIEEVAGEQPGRIIKEVQPGFLLNNNVMIPAKVVVGK